MNRYRIASWIIGFYIAVLSLLAAFKARAADALTPAPAPQDWTMLGLLFVVVALVAVGFYLHRRFPSQAAIADTEAKKLGTKAVQDLADAVHKLREQVALPPPVVGAIVSTASAPAGKNGQAGPLTIQCTGDPAKDLASFQAAYFTPS
jgi:hypothetical protein